jgi:hypothetical protein
MDFTGTKGVSESFRSSADEKSTKKPDDKNSFEWISEVLYLEHGQIEPRTIGALLPHLLVEISPKESRARKLGDGS